MPGGGFAWSAGTAAPWSTIISCMPSRVLMVKTCFSTSRCLVKLSISWTKRESRDSIWRMQPLLRSFDVFPWLFDADAGVKQRSTWKRMKHRGTRRISRGIGRCCETGPRKCQDLAAMIIGRRWSSSLRHMELSCSGSARQYNGIATYEELYLRDVHTFVYFRSSPDQRWLEEACSIERVFSVKVLKLWCVVRSDELRDRVSFWSDLCYWHILNIVIALFNWIVVYKLSRLERESNYLFIFNCVH